MRWALFLGVLPLAACEVTDRGTRCGIAALAGPTMLLDEFSKSGTTLTEVPAAMPPSLVVRMVAGGAQRAIVGRTDSSWVIGVDGPIDFANKAGFGVLLVDRLAGPQGVVIYEGHPIPGAPVLGSVNLGATYIPLIGLTTQAASFQDRRCPLFPDSLRN